MDYFFFYGTLLDSEVFSIVLERRPSELFEQNLEIKGFSSFKVLKEKFPVLLPDPNGSVSGKVYRIPDNLKKRLFFFEDVGVDFVVEELETKISGKSVFYFSPTGKLELGEGLWTFDEFNKSRGDYVNMCIDLMKRGHFPV
ncbi:gamma-glutamylcyclotransferase [Bacteriovoracales bacterium]|nr:gamma-glutamylcyclotransferase [Bacteriovoracales bacterium]